MTGSHYIRQPSDVPGRETLLSMSGLEYLQSMLNGQIPHSAISSLMSFHMKEVEFGRIVFQGAPAFEHTNPLGAVHGGWYGTLLDSALTCAVMTSLPQGRWCTTLEYKVNLIRALPIGTMVIAEGIVDHSGNTTAVAHGTIRGADNGKLYATGSTTCIVIS